MTQTFCYPYKRGTGWRSQGFRSGKGSPYNAAGGHTGFDQAMDAGTPIYAPGDGIIRNSGWLTDNYLANPWWLTAMGGDTLVLDCTDAFGNSDTMPTFIFAHLQDSIPEVGTRVKKGHLIGISGNSGTATTGAHVHIEALPPNWDWNNGVYGRVDPEIYFTEWPEDINGGAALGPQGTTITPKEWDEMATEKQLYDVMAKALWEVLEGGRATKRLQTIFMASTAPSTDGKPWTLSSHLKGTAVRTVQIVKDVAALRGELAGVKNQVAQLAKASGTQLDTAAVAAASAEGTRTALAEAQALDAKLIADAVVDEQAARLANGAAV